MFRRTRRNVTVLVALAVVCGSAIPASTCVKNIEGVRLTILRHSQFEATVVVKGYCTMILEHDMPCVCGVSARQTDVCFKPVSRVP